LVTAVNHNQNYTQEYNSSVKVIEKLDMHELNRHVPDSIMYQVKSITPSVKKQLQPKKPIITKNRINYTNQAPPSL